MQKIKDLGHTAQGVDGGGLLRGAAHGHGTDEDLTFAAAGAGATVGDGPDSTDR